MGLRRFQNFSLGAMNAQRLNEIVDTVNRLEHQVGGIASGFGGGAPMTRDRIIARIKGEGRYTRQQNCENRVECCAYPFDEVFLRTSGDGLLGEDTCVEYEVPQDAISSDGQAYLLIMEPWPLPRIGQVLVAHLASLGSGGNFRQMVYLGTPVKLAGEVAVYRITAQADGLGRYFGLPMASPGGTGGGGDGDPKEIINLYETNQYYGALDTSNGNQCVQLTARALGIGATVSVIEYGGTLYTMASTAFRPDCVPCTPTQGVAAMQQDRAQELAVAGIMMR